MLNDQRVRVQLWDQGSNLNAQTTFQPLYIRHVSGCIIVCNTSNSKSIENAYRWKEEFDKRTKLPDEPGLPCCLFINHDHLVADDDDEEKAMTFAESDPRAKEGYLKTMIDQDRLLEFEQKA